MSGPRSGGAGTPPTGTGSPPRARAAPSGRAVPETVRPHGIRQRRCGSAGRRMAGTTTTERRRPCCARSGSCESTGQVCLTSAPHGGPAWTARTRGSVSLRWALVGRDAGTGQERSVLLASVAGFPYQRGRPGTSSVTVGWGSGAGPPNARAHDQPAAVFGEKQHERPGPIGSPDLPQANRLLMLAEPLHCVCQVRGLDAPEAPVPQPKSVDKGERLGRRSPVPDHVETAAAERSQSGYRRLVVADQQPFPLCQPWVRHPASSG